jgi:hypothetical protein
MTDIVEQLRQKAHGSAEASQMLARAKSERNKAAGDVGADYEGGTPEQMIEWRAADEIVRLRGLLADDQYIQMRADYAKGHKSWANMINEREARRP